MGVQPEPYRTQTLYHSGYSGYGLGGYSLSNNRGNASLEPEKKTEFEIGADLRFLRDRLQANLTLYKNHTNDLLLLVDTPPSSGFTSQYKNAGRLQNKGIEVDFKYQIIQTNKFLLSLNTNFSSNKSLVTDLASTKQVAVGGIGGFMHEAAVVGYPVGVFFGGQYARDKNGNKLFDDNGFPLVATTQGVIGDPNPDWKGGIGGDISYRGFSLHFLVQTLQGADFYPGTKSVMYHFGTHKDVGNEVTLKKDLRNFDGDLVKAGTTVRGKVEDLGAGPVLLDESYYTSLGGGFSGLKEQWVTDGSWTRLRELSLGYNLVFPSINDHIGIKSMEFRLTGRNLLLWTPVEGFDPNSNHTQGTIGRGLDYFDNPSTRSYEFTIKLNI